MSKFKEVLENVKKNKLKKNKVLHGKSLVNFQDILEKARRGQISEVEKTELLEHQKYILDGNGLFTTEVVFFGNKNFPVGSYKIVNREITSISENGEYTYKGGEKTDKTVQKEHYNKNKGKLNIYELNISNCEYTSWDLLDEKDFSASEIDEENLANIDESFEKIDMSDSKEL